MIVPVKVPLAELAEQARAGDADAALLLAKRAPCAGFLPFLAKFVPEGTMTILAFDTLNDAYYRMEMEREALAGE